VVFFCYCDRIANTTNANAVRQRSARFFEKWQPQLAAWSTCRRTSMGWGNPSPNGLLLEDQFVEVDYGGAIGKWWVRPLGKSKAETLEKPVDEMLDVAWSRSPDADDEKYHQSLPSVRLRRSTKKN